MTESRSPLSRPRAATAGAALLACAAALAGCGGGSVNDSGTVRVSLRDFRITPQKVHTSTGALTFEVTNDGRLTHSLSITTDAGKRLATSDPVAPGRSTTLKANLGRGGYLMTSSIQSDKALGLYGTLDVG